MYAIRSYYGRGSSGYLNYLGYVPHDAPHHVALVHRVNVDPPHAVRHEVDYLLRGVGDSRLLHGIGAFAEPVDQ